MNKLNRAWAFVAWTSCASGLGLVAACSDEAALPGANAPTSADASVPGEPSDAASPTLDAGDAAIPPDAETDAGEGSCTDVLPAGPKPTTPALCTAGNWSVVAAVDLPTDNLDVLRSITPDERTIAWAATGIHFTVLKVGDRATDSAPFTRVHEVTGFIEGSLLGLSPDGLRLCGSDLSGDTLIEATRASRTEDFGEPTEGSFALLDADARTRSGRIVACVISPDDRALYYNLSDAAHPEPRLHVSRRVDGSPWPIGVPVPSCALRSEGDAPSYYPTAISADDRTIFYQSPLVPVPRMATRAGADWPFDEVVDLPSKGTVIPNQDCSRVYFNGSKDGVSGIYVASPN